MKALTKLFSLTLIVLVLALVSSYALAATTATRPSNNTYTLNATAAIVFDYSHDGTLNSTISPTCQLYVDNVLADTVVNVPPNTTQHVVSDVEIGDGNRTWWVRCTNGTITELNGNYTLTVDRTAPTVALNSPISGGNYSNTSITFQWTVTDTNADQANLNVNNSANTSSIKVYNGVMATRVIPGFQEGVFAWNVTANDSVNIRGNSSSVSFTIDRTAPSAVTINTVNMSNYTTTTPTISVTAVDALASALHCSIFVDGVANTADAYVPNNAATNIVMSAVTEGFNKKYNVTCLDPVNNNRTSALTSFTVDKTLPTISYLAPINGTNTSASAIQVNYTLLDSITQSGWVNSTLTVGSTTIRPNGTSNGTTIGWNLSLVEGTYGIRINITDGATNQRNYSTYYVTIDRTAPLSVSISNMTNYSSVTPTISFTAIDTYSSRMGCDVYVNGTLNKANVNATNNTAASVTLNTLNQSFYQKYNITCRDPLNNATTSALTGFTIDARKPRLTIISPVDYYNATASSSVGFNFTVVDDITQSGWINATLYVDNQFNMSLVITNNTVVVFNSTLHAGYHNWSIIARDGSGNANTSANRTIFVDATSPSISNVVIANYTNNTIVNISGYSMMGSINITGTDNSSYIDKCSMKILQRTGSLRNNISDSRAIMNATGQKSRSCYYSIYPDDVLEDGYFTVQMTINDSFGSESSKNFSNWTKTTLYNGTWNLVGIFDNTTFGAISELSGVITHVSMWNNNNATFTSLVKGTSTNNGTRVSMSDVVHVYTNSNQSTVSLMRYWSSNDVRVINKTFYNATTTPGWNVVTVFNATDKVTTGGLCNVALYNATTSDTKYISTFRGNESRYYTHRCGFTLYSAITIPRGQGVWIAVQNGTNWEYIDKPATDNTFGEI